MGHASPSSASNCESDACARAKFSPSSSPSRRLKRVASRVESVGIENGRRHDVDFRIRLTQHLHKDLTRRRTRPDQLCRYPA